MGHTVALVQAYLQINGYFTVADYPIIESTGSVETADHAYGTIAIGHIVQFIENYLDEHWEVLHSAQFKHPVPGLFIVLKKAGLEMSKGNKR